MDIENVFAALASTPRRRILAYLAETSLTASEIAARFDMTKPSLSMRPACSRILRCFESDKRGQFVHYRLADDNLLGTLHNFLATFCPVGGRLKKESAALAKAKKRAAAPKSP